MIPKLSGACYAIRSIVHISYINTVQSIYCAYCHSVIKHGIILGVNSSNSGKIFTLHIKIVRIMAGAQPSNVCRSLFKQKEVLPVPCQYILSLMNFIINNQEIFKTNHLYAILIQEQAPSSQTKCQPLLFSRKYILCWHQNFQQSTT
jgi:hypothetical protein